MLIFIWNLDFNTEKEKNEEKDLLPSGSLLKWLQQPGPSQVESWSQVSNVDNRYSSGGADI